MKELLTCRWDEDLVALACLGAEGSRELEDVEVASADESW